MKLGQGGEVYRTAFILSVVAHIFFVTAAEAALILTKQLNPDPVFSLTISTSSVSSEIAFVASLPRNDVPEGTAKNAVIAKMSEADPGWSSGGRPLRSPVPDGWSGETIPNLRSNMPKNQPRVNAKGPVFPKKVKRFKKRQIFIDQRITTVKKQIIQKQIELLQSIGSSVYDAEKIPVDLRKSVLPDYLKQMRLQILSQWLNLLETVECKSCVSIVEYKIAPRGKIFDLILLSLSQDQNFDSACMKAVTQSNPLPPLPFNFDEEIKEDYLTVSLTFYLEKTKPKLPKDLTRHS